MTSCMDDIEDTMSRSTSCVHVVSAGVAMLCAVRLVGVIGFAVTTGNTNRDIRDVHAQIEKQMW